MKNAVANGGLGKLERGMLEKARLRAEQASAADAAQAAMVEAAPEGSRTIMGVAFEVWNRRQPPEYFARGLMEVFGAEPCAWNGYAARARDLAEHRMSPDGIRRALEAAGRPGVKDQSKVFLHVATQEVRAMVG